MDVVLAAGNAGRFTVMGGDNDMSFSRTEWKILPDGYSELRMKKAVISARWSKHRSCNDGAADVS
jgi:hypothetical protein